MLYILYIYICIYTYVYSSIAHEKKSYREYPKVQYLGLYYGTLLYM